MLAFPQVILVSLILTAYTVGVNFYKQQEVAKKWLKLKYYRKTHIHVFQRLRLKRQVKTLWGAQKSIPLSYFHSFHLLMQIDLQEKHFPNQF